MKKNKGKKSKSLNKYVIQYIEGDEEYEFYSLLKMIVLFIKLN